MLTSPLARILPVALTFATPACVRKTEADRAGATTAQIPPDGVSEDLPVLGALTDFDLTERDGSKVNLATLKGDVVVMNFMFASCTGPCPLMAGQIKTLQAYVRDRPGVRFVSVSTDPEHDTPAVLTEYAARYGADPKRWLFLTGTKAESVRLSRDVLKLPSGEDPGMHTTRFALIDAAHQVRAYVDSSDAEFQVTMRRSIDKLLGADAAH